MMCTEDKPYPPFLLERPKHNCPFYGMSLTQHTVSDGEKTLPFVMIATMGNQCGLVINAHSPCVLKIASLPVDWYKCPYVDATRLNLGNDKTVST